MLRQEEDDLTQEIRQLVMLETKLEIERMIKVLEDLKIEIKDEFSQGVNIGLELAIKYLQKGKSAISTPQT